ncbi:MAG: type II CAAX endopeptidase family protein [Candidatus Omnitrophica bacterium]|nr:type II CAAX endopeptidase family protein [Candidatus Omnitrophota bacterium]
MPDFSGYKTLPKPAIILFSFYAIIFVIGSINFIRLIYKKISRQPFFESTKFAENIQLSSEKTWKLFFYLAFSFNVLTLITRSLPLDKIPMTPLHLTIFLNILVEVGLIFVILRFLPFKDIKLQTNKKTIFNLIKLYTAIIPVILVSFFINAWILNLINTESTINPAIEIMLILKDNQYMTVLFFLVVFIGPIAEELLFRGILYNHLRRKNSYLFSAIISSLIFSLIHRIPINILPLFVISLSISYVYEKTHNLSSAIIFHSLHNFLNFTALLVMKTML